MDVPDSLAATKPPVSPNSSDTSRRFWFLPVSTALTIETALPVEKTTTDVAKPGAILSLDRVRRRYTRVAPVAHFHEATLEWHRCILGWHRSVSK